jgi:murein endopeptidase
VSRRLVILSAAMLGLAAAAAALTVLVVSGSDASAPVTLAASSPESEPVVASPAPAVVKPLRVPAHRRRAAVTIPHRSRPLGHPNAGSLEGGVVLPAAGQDFFTWDGPSASMPNPDWRRVGTDTLVTWLQGVLRYFRAAHPGAPRIGIGDLSLPHGGAFGRDYGGLGHASHQNGLDVDVLYPRLDRAERPAERVEVVDRALSQALVDTFVAAGARFAFVGEHVGLAGPGAIVQAIPNHDDHVHVRIDAIG